MIRDKEMLPHLEKSLHILSPWINTIDSDAINQFISIDSIKTNILLKKSTDLELNKAILATNRNQYYVAERHGH
jgi:lipid A disaccharide synthetase